MDTVQLELETKKQLETKRFVSFEIKDAGTGMVEAVVATLNVVDLDRDVILSGAIRDGTRVKISDYDHSVITEGKMPVGKGVISIQGDKVVLSGQYFLNTTNGRDAFEMVKALGPDSEWSIGFIPPTPSQTRPVSDEFRAQGARRIIAELPTLEASPVLIGAGIETRTLATKAADEEAVAAAAAEAARKSDLDRQAQEAFNVEIQRKAAEQLEQFERTRKRLERMCR